MRAQMQAEKQQQQMMAMAQPAQQGAQAAELLSRTQVGPDGATMLDQMMGV